MHYHFSNWEIKTKFSFSLKISTLLLHSWNLVCVLWTWQPLFNWWVIFCWTNFVYENEYTLLKMSAIGLSSNQPIFCCQYIYYYFFLIIILFLSMLKICLGGDTCKTRTDIQKTQTKKQLRDPTAITFVKLFLCEKFACFVFFK